MILELMLYGLATMLRRNARTPPMQARLRGRNCTIQVQTRDGRVGRAFVFGGGEVFSRSGISPNPDVAMVWKDAPTAVTVFRDKNPNALQTALANEWLRIDGNSELAIWFGDLARTARGDNAHQEPKADTVAVIGLGRMGGGIAHSLLSAGFPLVVYNRSPEKARILVEAGAKLAATPAEAASAARFVITSLMDDSSVADVVQGPRGLLAGLEHGCIHIGASTISAQATIRLVELHKAHGSHYLASPVVGRPDAAKAGELVTLVAGERNAFDASRVVLQGFARMIQYLGENHLVACQTKLAVNYVAATLIELMGQVYTFGEKAGIPEDTFHTLFRMMWAQPAMQGYATRMWHREFDEVGFDLRGGLKDISLMIGAAKERGVRWEFAEAIQRKMTRGIDMGFGAKDWSSTYKVTRAESGLGD